MEALQMLKFYLKKDHLNFMQSLITSNTEMVEDDAEGDLLANLFWPEGNVQNGMDHIMQAINAYED